jgi:hypothetical protein
MSNESNILNDSIYFWYSKKEFIFASLKIIPPTKGSKSRKNEKDISTIVTKEKK